MTEHMMIAAQEDADGVLRWAESELPKGAQLLAKSVLDSVVKLVEEVRRLQCEIVGLQKANALLNAGMGNVCESRDEMKLELRKLKGEQS